MSPNYVMVVQSEPCPTTTTHMDFKDDLQALVAARRLFMQELVAADDRPLSLIVGRQEADGQVAWLSTWSVGREGEPEQRMPQAPPARKAARKPPLRRPAARAPALARRTATKG